MLVRQLPWTVADAAHGRGLESRLYASGAFDRDPELHNQHPAFYEVGLFPAWQKQPSPKVVVVEVEPHLIADTSLVAGEQISGGVFGDDSATI
jgi:hypothetical protein